MHWLVHWLVVSGLTLGCCFSFLLLLLLSWLPFATQEPFILYLSLHYAALLSSLVIAFNIRSLYSASCVVHAIARLLIFNSDSTRWNNHSFLFVQMR